MKHPSTYSTVPFRGFHIMVVDVGTKIKDERSGNETTITDECAAQKGRVFYCTQKTFDLLLKNNLNEAQ